MRIIGVTGGIGSGKSTVASILKRLGARVIDADAIGRQITARGQKAFYEIVENFGENILDPKGQIDRKLLAQLVFSDSDKLKLLNRITHRHIIEQMMAEVEKARREGFDGTLVLDVPIPVEQGFLDTADEVWVVTADMEERLKRVMKRSGFSKEEVLKRIQSQPAQEEYLKLADRVIHNNGSLEQLEREVSLLYGAG